MVNPYAKGYSSKKNSAYQNSLGSSLEVDMRRELQELFNDEERSNYFLYRRIKTDAKGKPIKHPYVHTNRSGEGPKDVGAIGSTSNGWMYDDHLVWGFMNHSQAYSILYSPATV